MVPDSAATAFAMFSGVKTNYFTMGYDKSIVLGSAASMVRYKIFMLLSTISKG